MYNLYVECSKFSGFLDGKDITENTCVRKLQEHMQFSANTQEKNLRGIISPLFCDMNNTCRKEIQISKKHDPQNQSSTLQHPTPTNQTTTSLATDGVLCVSLVAKVLFLFTASCEIVCSNPAESPLSTSHSPTATADGRSKQAWDETNPNRRTT